MKFFTRILAALSTALLLASCGGGGGSDGGAFTPAPASLVAVATPSSIAPLGVSNIEVTAKKGDGSAVVDGTTISILLSPTTLATTSASVATVGGRASFPITALANTGTVRVTVSMADPGIANRTTTSTVDVTIAGTVPVSRMVAVASPTTISQGASSDIVVTFTRADGSNVPDGTTISALASPASIGTIQGSSGTVGGKANFTFRSGTQNGTATIQFSGLDSSGATVPVTTSVTITVTGAAPAGVLTAVATPTTITRNAFSNLAIRLVRANGQAVADGTTINAALSPSNIGSLTGVAGSSGAAVSNTTVGGNTTFRFNSASTEGTARITISSVDPEDPTKTLTANVTITIAGGAPVLLTAVATPPTITRNALSTVAVTLKKANGDPVANGTVINAALTPTTLGTLTGSATPGSAVTNTTVGGNTTFRFNSTSIEGTARITISAVDPEDSTRTLTAEVQVVVVGNAAVLLTAVATPTTITRNAQSNVAVTLVRANGDPVADGTLINAAITPTSLGTISGNAVAGSTASNATVGGSTNFRFNSASQEGTVRIVVSAVDPEDSTRTLTATVQVVIAGLPSQARFTAVASPVQVTRNAISNVLVTLQRPNGDAVVDGTTINAVLSPANIGNIAGSGAAGTTASNATVGGRSNFQFISGNVEGIATIVVSAVDPEDATRTLTATVVITVAGDAASRITVTPSLTKLTQSATTDVAVVVTNRTGQPVADGSTVNLTVTPASIGTVSNAVGGAPSNQATATTIGGRANFRFNSGIIDGVALLTASTPDPDVTGATLSASAQITVAGVGVPRLSAVATTTVLPPNLFGIAPFIGSPYISEIDVTWRRANGQLVNGSTVAVSVNPVTFGGYSTLDDGTTPDINEFTIIMGQGPVNVVAGKATLFFHSFTLPGSATVTITAVDPDTQETLQTQVVITVAPSAVPLPSAVTAISQNNAVYIQDSGGRTSATLVAQVVDGSGNPVPNPVSGNNIWNNVAFELVNAAGLGGARLRAIDADGINTTGARVLTRTFNGQATATFESGTVSGGITIRVIADRADNNVSNGIQDPLAGTITLTVSDGKLYSIVLTSPTPNGLTVNTVAAAGAGGNPTSPNAGPRNVGNNDGTYSLTVSALATDRGGNPVIQGTALRFGVIDSPLYGFPQLGHGIFYLTGSDGNPWESNSLFTATTGQFRTAGGGAGPGDTLLVFGQLRPDTGNRDLQEARTVATVNSDTSLNITSIFNPNDDFGTSVDNGAILPYVIGRATEVNIGSDAGGIAVQASTNAFGVATVTLNYPVTRLGKAAYLYAQGDRPGSTTRKVTGTAGIALPGARPARISASSSIIPGNATIDLLVCFRDVNAEPLNGYTLNFNFHDLGGGTGFVDSVPTSGTVGSTTGGSGGPNPPLGFDGCVTARIRTLGITSADADAGVIFSLGDAIVADVAITTGANAQNVVNVTPSSLGADGGPVTIRVTDAAGTPLAGLPIQVECEASGDGAGISSTIPAVTNATGTSTATISTTNFSGFGFAGTGTCTYTVGGSSAVVNVAGVDFCTPAGGTSPGSTPPAACETPPPQAVVLQVIPSLINFATPNTSQNVTLRLVTSQGFPVSGAQIGGNCGAGVGISSVIPPTAAGQSAATITSTLTAPTTCPGAPATSTCTFVTSFGATATATLNIQGPSCP